jgi:hypothetical protein
MFARSDIYFRLHLLLIIIHITCISLSLRRTSAPIHLTSVSGVLGTQETSYIVIVGLLERDTFDLFLSEFDKPWVIHLRETCCCSTNLCTWRPNTVYKNRRVHRHHPLPLASCSEVNARSSFILGWKLSPLNCFVQQPSRVKLRNKVRVCQWLSCANCEECVIIYLVSQTQRMLTWYIVFRGGASI